MKISLTNHGCAKNLVDSELMLGFLVQKGYSITLDENEADISIVNTCSFIHDAEQESVESILRLVDMGKKVIITGCLPQKHKKELKKAIPESVAMLGTTDFEKIVEVIEEVKKGKYFEEISSNPVYKYPENIERQQITVGSSSYLKIADGCNYACGYCIIPQLRGKQQSRSIEDIVKEAKYLAQKGVSELVLVAQDSTSYGIDLYGRPSLSALLKELNKIEEIVWIRIMYAYPTSMDDELIETIASLDKVVKYVDIPLQHSHPEVLKSMRRPVQDYEKLIKKLRDKIPGVSIRTAFIVGYPQETQEQFEHLYDFIEKMRFDKLGVFEYSKEKNTYSYGLKPHVSARVKKQRYKSLMKLQQGISKEINQSYIGKTLDCLIESITSEGLVIARSFKDAPEIDGLVYIETDKPVQIGEVEKVLIKNSDEYDLFGVI